MNTKKSQLISLTWLIAATLILTLFVLGACNQAAPTQPADSSAGSSAGGATEESKPAEASSPGGEKVLIVAVDGDIDTFDPCCTVGTKTSQTTIQNTFDQLTQYAQVEKTLPNGEKYMTVDTSKIIGMLAESWEQKDNVVTFHLRKDIKFQNGDPITAQTIVDGYKRIFEVGGLSSFLLTMGSVTKPDEFKAVDDLTIQMTMATPNNLVNLNNVMHNTSTVDPKEVTEHKTDTDPWAGG